MDHGSRHPGEKYGFSIRTYLKIGCPLTTEESPKHFGNAYPECRIWIDNVLPRIIQDHPDFVFTTSTRPRSEPTGDITPESYLGIWEKLQSNTIGILGIRDTPWLTKDGFPFLASDCLADAGNPKTCGMQRNKVLDPINPTLAYLTSFPGLHLLDISNAMCNDDFCPAVIGNILVYYDAHHLSSTFARSLVPELSRQLSQATHWW
ncbi:MAG: SGNH hydrolase domain-containing protein [Mycobacteriaceae bacterium]